MTETSMKKTRIKVLIDNTFFASSFPKYLLSEQMPQGGHTETVDASEIDLPTIWAKVEELSRVKR